MSRKKQKVVEDNVSSSESEKSYDEEELANTEMETIQVDFDVKFPEDIDFHGIKNLLRQLFLKADVNLSELTDLLIKQHKITGVIKQAVDDENMDIDDEDLEVNFGVFSVINLTDRKDYECVKQIQTHLLSQCKQSASNGEFEVLQKILNNSKKAVGFIVSERMVNIPPKIAVPLYSNLTHDMSKEKGFKNFEFFILICKIMEFSNPRTSKKKKEVESNDYISPIYTNAEEEVIAEFATLSFDYSVPSDTESDLSSGWTDESDGGRRKRRVLVLPASNWEPMCAKLAVELNM